MGFYDGLMRSSNFFKKKKRKKTFSNKESKTKTYSTYKVEKVKENKGIDIDII